MREVVRIEKKVLRKGHPDYALHLNNLATLLTKQVCFDPPPDITSVASIDVSLL